MTHFTVGINLNIQLRKEKHLKLPSDLKFALSVAFRTPWSLLDSILEAPLQ